MNRQNESSAEATTENIENKLDPNTPEILESKRGKNSKEHVSDPSRLDIEGYIFKDSKLIKKKKKVYTRERERRIKKNKKVAKEEGSFYKLETGTNAK